MLDEYIEISPEEKKILFTKETRFVPHSDIVNRCIDFIASGLASKFVEDYIKDNIFLNIVIHSNSTNGICMKTEISDTRDVIKTEYGRRFVRNTIQRVWVYGLHKLLIKLFRVLKIL
jgi:hypothetical protein